MTAGRSLLLLAACGLFCGCISGSRGARLYDAPTPLSLEQVATLEGYVESVDGRDVVGLAQPFELLPGCHVVVTPNHWGRGSPYGAAIATTPHVSYAIEMDAGSRYVIDLSLEPALGDGTPGRVRLGARELGRGRPDRGLAPAENVSELESCRRRGETQNRPPR